MTTSGEGDTKRSRRLQPFLAAWVSHHNNMASSAALDKPKVEQSHIAASQSGKKEEE